MSDEQDRATLALESLQSHGVVAQTGGQHFDGDDVAKQDVVRSEDDGHPATAEAADLLSSECPTYRALSAVGRLQAMEQRLDAMRRAVETVQPALERFYGSLNDEQKERFNRLSPAQG